MTDIKYLLRILVFLAVGVLCGCAASTQIVKNEEVEIKSYRELYLIPPTEDPRNIVPRVVEEFETLGMNVRLVDPDKPIEGAEGSGFIVDELGHIITCQHVIGDEEEATIWLEGKRFEASVIATEKEVDLALLKLRGEAIPKIKPLRLRTGNTPKIGEDIFAMGYPMSNVLGSGVRLSKGLISSTQGIEGNPNQIQVSAEIQPGNSGGPIFDSNAMVVGVVQETLNPWKMVGQSGGALPQNVNFAIRSIVAQEFLISNLGYQIQGPHVDSLDFSEVEKAVVKVKSGILPLDLENKPKLVVLLEYASVWDLWYRFKYLVFSFYDFDTQEILFQVGQGYDNMVSNEEVVISDTFKKIEAALNSN